MPQFKNLPQQYLLPNPSSYSPSSPISSSEIIALSPSSPLTVGRSHQNTLQLLDNTISKKHAKISYVNKMYYLYDLDSANGVYVNGQKMGPDRKKTVLQNGDCVQFGKYAVLYKFVDRTTRNKSKGKSRINLKDYLFQESSDNNQFKQKQKLIDNSINRGKNNNNSAIDNLQGQQSVLTQPISPSKQKAARTKKIKPKQSKIRIPDLTDYLKLAEPMNQPQAGPGETSKNQYNNERQDNKYMRTKISNNASNNTKQTKIKLQSLQQQILNYDQLKQFRLDKRQRNIYVQQQEALSKIQSQKRKIQQQKLRKQLQNAKIAQDLLQKQLLLQQKVREQQQKVQKQKQRLQEQFVKRQQIKREEQINKFQQMEQKQKSMMQKLEQQRRNQIQQLKQKQQIIKQQSQTLYKTQYQKRKKQLQIEAQALARQYQNIYRETIKKVRTQIDNQQITIQKLQQKEELLRKQQGELSDNIEILREELQKSKNMFVRISGRNKACVLYASDIQDKIDAIGTKQFKQKQQGYYVPTGKDNPTVLKKLQQSITTSRKLLKIKSHEHNSLLQQIVSLSAVIKQKQSASSSDIVQFVDTVYENLLVIGKLKEEYLELVEVQRGVQGIWNAEIQENNQFSNKNRVLQSEINKNIREIDQNLRDQIKKSTQQRLHMLKVMHFCPEQKKNAAKFLIQQMLSLQQQIHKFKLQNEQSHKQISKTITKSQKLKRQNQYLSQILFSQDENGHHFDNMKIVINNIMQKIQQQTAIDNVNDCIQLSKEIKKYQLMIQGEIQRKKGLREGMRKIGELGLAPGQVKISEKNPLVFFGDLFTNKQIQVQQRKYKITNLQDQANALKNQIRLLDERKSKISDSLQKYKIQQLSQARKYLGK